MYGFEKGPGFKGALGALARDANVNNIVTGIVAAVFGLSVVGIYFGAGMEGGLTVDQLTAWVIGTYLINGIAGLILPFYYRLPIATANSIPGAILFTSLVPMFGLRAVLGACILSGLIILVLGVTGSIEKAVQILPVPIVLGMTGGILLKFGIQMISAIPAAPLATIIMLAVYFVSNRITKKFPAILTTIIVGAIIMYVQGVDMSGLEVSVYFPRLITPVFSWGAIVSYSVPLAILIIGGENASSIGVFMGQGYKPPVNGMTIFSGIGGLIAPFFGAHNCNIAGPMTAICASEDSGDLDKRWVAAVVVAVIWIITAPFLGTMVKFFEIVPGYFLAVIVGLTLLKVLISCIGDSIGSPTHNMGALFAFLIGASGVTFFNLSAPFWALVGGLVVSLLFEYDDFGFGAKKAEVAEKSV